MPLTVRWDDGVSVEYGETRVIFDPQKNNHSHSSIFITHAHFDHSRGLSFVDGEKVSTEETKEIVQAYGKVVDRWRPLPIDGRVKMEDLEVVSHNAGHVLGSALYEVVTPEGNVVYTGDLQFRDSFTLKAAEPISCDVLVIETTFGSPSFRFPEREAVARSMVQWAGETMKSGKVPTFKADSLGNAQEITKAFNTLSELPVIVHWRIAQINEIYNTRGQGLEFLDARSEEASDVISSGECVFITPKNVSLANHAELEPALVSGWAVWAKQDRNAFALSDHADFGQLMEFVDSCTPRTVLTCFGRERDTIFANQVQQRLRIEARPLKLIPTEFVSEQVKPRVRSCMKEILKAMRMPGFVYSERWINDEMRSLGFSDHEALEALDRLTRIGMLKASRNAVENG
jgi:Cft2 family RNA processing exonuclease